jgi:hypothetical protein
VLLPAKVTGDHLQKYLRVFSVVAILFRTLKYQCEIAYFVKNLRVEYLSYVPPSPSTHSTKKWRSKRLWNMKGKQHDKVAEVCAVCGI